MRPLTLQRLEIFRAVYEEKSVTGAADRLRLAQPTVSRHLRDFEAALGLPLFTLSQGRLTSTPEADILYRECVFLSEGASRFEASVRALRQGSAQPLSVMSISLLVKDVLPAAITATLRALPSLSLTAEIGSADDQLRALRNGSIDVGLAAGDIVTVAGLDRRRIGGGRFVCIVPEEHPFAGRERLTLADLRGERLRVNLPRRPIGRILLSVMEEAGLRISGEVTASSLQLMPGLAAALRSCVVVDDFSAAAFPQPTTRVLPLDGVPGFDIFALTRTMAGRGKAAETFIAEVRRALERLAEDQFRSARQPARTMGWQDQGAVAPDCRRPL